MRRLVKKFNNKEDGFTLIEVLVALVILSIIAIGLFSALGTSFITTGVSKERDTAKILAASQMEYVKALDWVDSRNIADPYSVYPPDTITSEYSGYTVTIKTTLDMEKRDENIQYITVTVFHHDEEVMQLEGEKLRADTEF